MIKNNSVDVAHINAKLLVNLTLSLHTAPVRPFLFMPMFASISNYRILKKKFQQLSLKGLTLLNFQQKEGTYSVYWLYC